MKSHTTKLWLMAFRPKTLAASVAPVLLGTAMAWGDGVHHWPVAFLCLLGALLIQIGTNLSNDYFDYKKGADTKERIGPTRVTQSGLIKPQQVLIAFSTVYSLAALIGGILIVRGGLPIALICGLSILSGILYTGGPKPFGYSGLGDLFVLIFFGPVAVAGTYYVQSLNVHLPIILAGLAPGLLSVAILSVNNYRDIESDRKSGKRTLAVRFGRTFAQIEYVSCILIASLIPILIYMYLKAHVYIVFSACTLLFALPVIKTLLTKTDGPSLNNALAATGKLLMLYSILFSIGWIL